MISRLAILAVSVGLCAALTGCKNPPAPDVSKLRTVDEVRDAYIKAADAKDTATMAALAEVPFFDTNRTLIRDKGELAKAVERVAPQMLPDKTRKVETIAYKTLRDKIEKEADRKLLDEVLGDDGSIVYLENEGYPLSERVILIRVKDGVARVVGGPLKGNQFSPQNVIPEAVQKALDKAETFELYSLEPGTGIARAKGERDPKKEYFHDYEVLGKTAVKGEDRKKVVEALRLGAEDNSGMVAGCFIPRHGIRLRTGKDTTDLVICFQCKSVSVYLNDKSEKGFLTTGDPQPTFDAVLKAAGVKLPKPAGE
jgi:hypothetical protein